MYNDYFGFTERPFASVPKVDLYYPGIAIEEARNTLGRCIERGEGVGLLAGPSGTGKTLLCQLLADHFKSAYQTALLSCCRLSTQRALLQAVLYELGRPYRGMDEGELRLALVDYISFSPDCPAGILLIIDEAHTLPLKPLEEVRALTNIVRDDQPRVRLILSGARVLEERFASPKLESFNQRLAARCYLEAFNFEETRAYIHCCVHYAGGDGQRLFSDAACQCVHRRADGVPRLINQLCDHALLLAFAAGHKTIEPAHIEESWADLQQLPIPMQSDSQESKAESGLIEFGSLDDQAEESGRATALPEAAEFPDDEPCSAAETLSQETSDMDESLEATQRQIESIQRMVGDVERDYRPAGSIGPEVELIFDEPRRALMEKFEQEEVVADRYVPPVNPATTGPPVMETVGYGLHHREEAADDDIARTVRLDALQEQIAPESDEDMIIVDEEYDDGQPSPSHPIRVVHQPEYNQLFSRLRRGQENGARAG